MRVLDKVDSVIRFQIPVDIDTNILQGHDVCISTKHGSYIETKPERFVEFCRDLVWSITFSHNETLDNASDNLQEGRVSENECVGALLACCRFGPYLDDAQG